MVLNSKTEAKEIAVKFLEADDRRDNITWTVRNLARKHPNLPPFNYLTDDQVKGLLGNTQKFEEYINNLQKIDSEIAGISKQFRPILEGFNPFYQLVEYQNKVWGFILNDKKINILRLPEFDIILQHENAEFI